MFLPTIIEEDNIYNLFLVDGTDVRIDKEWNDILNVEVINHAKYLLSLVDEFHCEDGDPKGLLDSQYEKNYEGHRIRFIFKVIHDSRCEILIYDVTNVDKNRVLNGESVLISLISHYSFTRLKR